MSLEFVDAARFSIVARNLFEGHGFILNYLFPKNGLSLPLGIFPYPPLFIYILSGGFKLFGVSDTVVILTSWLFFLLGGFTLFLLTSRLFDQKLALVSTLVYLLTPQLYRLANQGASDTLFIFEILLICYLLSFDKIWSVLIAGVILGIAMLTKLQGLWLTVPLLVLLALIYGRRIRFYLYFLVGIALTLVPGYLGLPLEFRITIPFYLLLQNSSAFPADNLPRSGLAANLTLADYINNLSVILKKTLYDLYNLVFKLLGLLAPPALLTVWALGLAYRPTGLARKYLIFSLVLLLTFLMGAAVTSPQVHYLYPALPFVSIYAVFGLTRLLKSWRLISLFLAAILVLPLLGQLVLDQRAKASQFNLNEPHINQILGQQLGKEAQVGQVVMTNLDTWGTWYGYKTTVMITLNFQQLERLDQTLKINQIFLTDYQRGNEDHPLSADWGQLFDNPQSVTNRFILDHFKLVKVATVSAGQDWEKQDFVYKVWARKP